MWYRVILYQVLIPTIPAATDNIIHMNITDPDPHNSNTSQRTGLLLSSSNWLLLLGILGRIELVSNHFSLFLDAFFDIVQNHSNPLVLHDWQTHRTGLMWCTIRQEETGMSKDSLIRLRLTQQQFLCRCSIYIKAGSVLFGQRYDAVYHSPGRYWYVLRWHTSKFPCIGVLIT